MTDSGSVILVGCTTTGSTHGKAWFRSLEESVTRLGMSVIAVEFEDVLERHRPALAVDQVIAIPGEMRRVLPSEALDAVTTAVGPSANARVVLAVRENYQRLSADLAARLSLRANDSAVVDLIQDKPACRNALRTAGFRQPLSIVVPANCDGATAASFLKTAVSLQEGERDTRRWILKPRTGMGSVGVRAFTDLQELRALIPERLDVDHTIEERVDGDEFSVEGLLVNGQASIYGITAKSVNPAFVETGHLHPVQPRPGGADPDICELLPEAFKVLGVRWGIFHVEFWQQADGSLIFGEFHCRQGGDFIHRLVELSRPGLKVFDDLLTSLAEGSTPPIPETRRVAGSRFVEVLQGRIVSLVVPDDLPSCVVVAEAEAELGQTVHASNGDLARAYALVAAASAPNVVKDALETAATRIEVTSE